MNRHSTDVFLFNSILIQWCLCFRFPFSYCFCRFFGCCTAHRALYFRFPFTLGSLFRHYKFNVFFSPFVISHFCYCVRSILRFASISLIQSTQWRPNNSIAQQKVKKQRAQHRNLQHRKCWMILLFCRVSLFLHLESESAKKMLKFSSVSFWFGFLLQ